MRRKTQQGLRKQPTTRRFQSAVPPYGGDLSVPPTARRRRRRNRPAVRNVLGAARWFLWSSRWISLIVLLAAVYGLYAIAQSPTFRLTEIPVEGTRFLSPVEVVEASQLAGVHVFAADPEAAARRVHDLPGIVAASVSLEWPNVVSIQIVEDTPVALWEQGGQRYWINPEGELIPARRDVPGLLVIQAEEPLELAGVAEREAVDLATAASEEATALHAPYVPEAVLSGALQLRELRPNIDRLFYRPSGGLSYLDGRGWRAYFGVGTDMAQKLVVYETLVEDLLARQLAPEYISVSNQEKPYYMARGG